MTRQELAAVARDMGERFAKQCEYAADEAALEEIAARLALAGQLLTRPPGGDAWSLIAKKAANDA